MIYLTLNISYKYYDATKEVANELGVPFIDMLTPHRELYLNAGIDAFKDIYNITPASLAKYKSAGDIGSEWTDKMDTNDDIHFCEEGSKLVAELFADALRKSDSNLKKYLK